jgi:hypothetical protein
MACHAFHVFYEPLELGSPASVDGNRVKMHGGLFQMLPDGKEILPPLVQTPETESYASVVTWDFPPRGSHPPLRLHWYDGACVLIDRLNWTAKSNSPPTGCCSWVRKAKC